MTERDCRPEQGLLQQRVGDQIDSAITIELGQPHLRDELPALSDGPESVLQGGNESLLRSGFPLEVISR